MITTRRGSDHYMLLEATELVSTAERNMKWMHHQDKIHDGVRLGHWRQYADVGDESLVERSEEFLEKIEDQIPVSRGWRNVDDVVGALPNVPAFLAGHPQHMRRRERAARNNAPLTIYMDLTSSMSISREDILQRGITLLALVRLLVEHRSVELWVGSSLGGTGVSGTAAWRIDTAPLDLARSAFHIADPSMSRIFGYAMCESMPDRHMGGFPHAEKVARDLREVAGWHEVLTIPFIHYSDPMVKDPVGWIRRVMAKYVPGQTAEEAA